MKKLTQIHNYFFDTMYNSPEASIFNGISYNDYRKNKLSLNVSLLQGKRVKEFYWNFDTLVLEFEQDLFLVIHALENAPDNDYMRLSIETTNHVVTLYDSLVITIIGPAGTADNTANYRELANKYIGKAFKDVFLTPNGVFLYFNEMPLIIQCMVCELEKPCGKFLTWFEDV